MDERQGPATEVDRAALETVKKVGMMPVEVAIPDWPYDSLELILFAEGAALRSRKSRSDHELDQLKMQVPDAWPNSFRQARFLSAVDFVQADRLRRKVAMEMERAVHAGGFAAGAFVARRDADDHQFYRASFADAARGICAGFAGAQRLGA